MPSPTTPVPYTPQAGVKQLVGPTMATEFGVRGVLWQIVVTTAGTAAVTLFDNSAGTASGTVLAVIPANATAGTEIQCNAAFNHGITVSGNVLNAAFTASIGEQE